MAVVRYIVNDVDACLPFYQPAPSSAHRPWSRAGDIAVACTTRPNRSTACTWYTRLDRSTPTRATGARVVSAMDFPFPF